MRGLVVLGLACVCYAVLTWAAWPLDTPRFVFVLAAVNGLNHLARVRQ